MCYVSHHGLKLLKDAGAVAIFTQGTQLFTGLDDAEHPHWKRWLWPPVCVKDFVFCPKHTLFVRNIGKILDPTGPSMYRLDAVRRSNQMDQLMIIITIITTIINH